MKIAIDVSPLESGHKVRGVGFYLQHLKQALEASGSEYEFVYFADKTPTSGVDLVHYPYFDPFFRTLPLRKSIPTVVTVHDLTPIVFPDHFPAGFHGNALWQLNRRLLKSVDAIITDSESSTRDVMKYVGIPPERVHTVYLAAGDNFKFLGRGSSENESLRAKNSELRMKYNLPEKFALYVGDVTWNKNLPRIIQASKVADIPLILVGKAITEQEFDRSNPWNNDRALVQQLLAEIPTTKALGFIPTEDVVALYNCAEVFVMPSLYEGFGLPVIEAMASGCPVVTSQEGSLKEVAGEAAYFVDAYDVESIAEGMKTVFESADKQRSLSKKGLEQAKKFSWKKTALNTLKVYQQVLGS